MFDRYEFLLTEFTSESTQRGKTPMERPRGETI